MAHGAPAPLPSALARHRQLAPTASVRVSPLSLGTMNFGDASKAHLGECSKETSIEILDTFVAAGGNFMYVNKGTKPFLFQRVCEGFPLLFNLIFLETLVLSVLNVLRN